MLATSPLRGDGKWVAFLSRYQRCKAQMHTSIRHQGFAGDVVGAFAGKKDDGFGNVVGGASAGERRGGFLLLADFLVFIFAEAI